MRRDEERFESETRGGGPVPGAGGGRVWWRLARVALIVAGAAALALWPWEGLTEAQRIMLGIFAGAAGLWMTEAIAPFATAILVIVVSVFLLGAPGGPMGFTGPTDYLVFVRPVADPVIVLFFGGFMLAVAATKTGLDRVLAGVLLRPFCGSGARLVLGVVLVTGCFSMFMSNTATAVMMIAILSPLVRGLGASRLARALVLGVAFAANIGGIGTIIGTPPNAVAVRALRDAGIEVSFLGWMLFGVPFALVMLGVLWGILVVVFRPERAAVCVDAGGTPWGDGRMVLVSVVFVVTVGLWLTEGLHGLRPEIVAMVPLAVFTATGLIGTADLKRIEWDVLVLVAGGLALGVGLRENFMSNTSAANIIVPVAVALSSGSPLVCAVVVALSASLAMSLPISTPPNAVVYGTGMLRGSDLLLWGSLVTVCGLVLLMVAASLIGVGR